METRKVVHMGMLIALAMVLSFIESQIPAFTYTSHVYSSDPAKRFIKLNGRQLSEGDTFMPGMVLTSITPDGAVFNMRGTVFSVRSLTDWNR